MFKIWIGFILLFVSTASYAQKCLLFYNTQTHKTIEIRPGNRVSLLYKGYLQQSEFTKETVTEITDSTITLGVDMSKFLPDSWSKPGKSPQFVYKTIRIEDILGFRKMSTGRQLTKVAFNVGCIVGSFYLLKNVYSSDISSGYKLLISFGVGYGIFGLNSLLFPENIKHYMENGWQLKVISDY